MIKFRSESTFFHLKNEDVVDLASDFVGSSDLFGEIESLFWSIQDEVSLLKKGDGSSK